MSQSTLTLNTTTSASLNGVFSSSSPAPTPDPATSVSLPPSVEAASQYLCPPSRSNSTEAGAALLVATSNSPREQSAEAAYLQEAHVATSPMDTLPREVAKVEIKTKLPSVGDNIIEKKFRVVAKALHYEAFGKNNECGAIQLYDGTSQIKVKSGTFGYLQPKLASVPLNTILVFAFTALTEAKIVAPYYQLVDCRAEVFVSSFNFFHPITPVGAFRREIKRLCDMVKPPTQMAATTPGEGETAGGEDQAIPTTTTTTTTTTTNMTSASATGFSPPANRTLFQLPPSTNNNSNMTPITTTTNSNKTTGETLCRDSITEYYFFVRIINIQVKSRMFDGWGDENKHVRTLTISDGRKNEEKRFFFYYDISPSDYSSLMAKTHKKKAEGLRGTEWAVLGRVMHVRDPKKRVNEEFTEVAMVSELKSWRFMDYRKPIDTPGREEDMSEVDADTFGVRDAQGVLAGLL